MKIMIDRDELIKLVVKQLDNIFGYNGNIELYINDALARAEKCFSHVNSKYYSENGATVFSPFHSVQYSIFLYYLANTVYIRGDDSLLATKLYYLNKVLNSVDWYYEIKLPEIFCAEHPVGSVLGRAKYSDNFYFYQNCTVGGNKGKYPILGENVIMFANSTVIGDTNIGKNVLISAHSLIKDQTIPDNCIVFGQSPNLTVKIKDYEYMSEHIYRIFK
jgi:serine O-acetyltransferase